MSSSKKRQASYTDPLFLNMKKLQSIFQQRRQIVASFKNQINQQPQIQQSYITQINQHCFEYTKIKSLVAQINNKMKQSKTKDPITDNAKFWQMNQAMERDLQQRLRNLKNIDITIDNIVNEEFDKCNQMDQIQQNIRSILSRKEQNHIQKAQPLYSQKQKCFEFLKLKKVEKQKIKNVKIKTLKQILSLLAELKGHRQARLKYCNQKNINPNQAKILQSLIHDFQQISRAKQTQQNILNNQKRYVSIIQDTNNRIQRLVQQIFDNMNQQIKAFNSLQNAMKDIIKITYFEKSVLKQIAPQYLNNQKNLIQLGNKYQNYLKQQSQKGKQSQRIKQGIATTTDTIKIFQHILDKIQSQNARRKTLLGYIQKVQQKHAFQSSNQQQIAQFESQIQRMQIKKHRLEKTLSAKVDQADVHAYKSTHSELQTLDKQLKRMINSLNKMKEQSRQYAKLLYQQTHYIQQQFKDILSQVVPSIWFRDKDFTKQQTIKDMNIYLIKTFKRLSIAD